MPRGTGSTADKQSKSRPGRLYHLKRLALAFVGLMLFLFVVRLWWGWEAHRRLQAEIDRIVARGEPLFPEDFNPTEEIPDDQNAAILYKKALKALNLTAEQDAFVGDRNRPPVEEWTEEQWQIVADITNASAEARALVRQARGLADTDWGVRVQSPAIAMLLPDLREQRNMAKLLRLMAQHQIRSGDYTGAIETIQDMLALGRTVGERPTLISHLVAIGTETLATEALRELLLATRILDNADSHVEATGAVDRDAIEQLLLPILDEESMQVGLRRALYCERMFQFDSAQIVAAGKLSFMSNYALPADATPSNAERILVYPISPLLEMEAAWMLKHMEVIIEASSKPTWLEADQLLRPLQIKAGQARLMPQRVVRPLSWILMPSLSRPVYMHYQYLDERRQMAIALAVRLYELDHGRRPEKLADLVPGYLPDVPIAPLLEDDQRYTYEDLNSDLLDPEPDAATADSREAEDDGEKPEDGQRQDDERGDGGGEP